MLLNFGCQHCLRALIYMLLAEIPFNSTTNKDFLNAPQSLLTLFVPPNALIRSKIAYYWTMQKCRDTLERSTPLQLKFCVCPFSYLANDYITNTEVSCGTANFCTWFNPIGLIGIQQFVQYRLSKSDRNSFINFIFNLQVQKTVKKQ